MTNLTPDNYRLLMAFHVFGVLLWTGTMLAVVNMLMTHAKAGEGARESLTQLEKKVAILMDIGATISIVTAFLLLLGHPVKPFILFKQGWLHIKLTLVVVPLLAVHGLARVKIKKFSRGEIKPLPGWIYPLLIVAILAIVILAVRQPLK
jgi:uncharacterized membrane protein